MKLLTIAVPAYNAEQHLSKCLDSICREDILDRLQIIIINDGSSDGTSILAHHYEKRFPQSIQVIDKENGGHGSGINAAIMYASGKYFQVVDSDDWVISENLSALMDRLEQTNADMILCHFHMIDLQTGDKREFKTKEIPLGKVYSFSEFMEHPRGAYTCCFFHGVLYRTDFYRNTGIRLSEKTFYEDQEYATIPIYYVETVLPLDLFLYQYSVGNALQSVADENQVRNIGQIETVFWKICDFYCSHRDMPNEKRQYFLFKLVMLLQSYCIVGLIKDTNRSRGRQAVKMMYRAVRMRCPELYRRFFYRYQILKAMHTMHISTQMFEWIRMIKK